MDPLLDLLDNARLLKGREVNVQRVASLTPTHLADLAAQSVDVTSAAGVEPQNNAFTHTASISLSGGTSSCAMQECRLNRAHELARFSALFSDKVFVHNILAERRHDSDNSNYKASFINDLEVISSLRPLIEQGRVVPISTLTNELCMHCVARETLNESDSRRFDGALRHLSKRLLNETSLSLRLRDHFLSIGIKGSPELIEHGTGGIIMPSIPDFIKAMPRIVAALKRGDSVAVSPTVRKKLSLEPYLAHSFFRDIAFELTASRCLQTSILTDRSLEVETLRAISADVEFDERDRLLQENLTCIIPFLNEFTPEELLKLRDTEGDALSTFRSALLKAIFEQKTKHGKFTNHEARMLYKDVLEPELARLNAKVKSARRTLSNSVLRTGVGWAAAITAGVWYGFMQSSVIEAAKALGFAKVIADSTSAALARREQVDVIRSEPMYFLWKVKRLARV